MPNHLAVALHNFVRDEILFGFSSSFWKHKASEVLEEKIGFCNTKSTLFIALLRAAKLPSRQIFVDIKAEILDGILATGEPYVDHSYVEILLEGNWVKSDSFIVDTRLFKAAQALLTKEQKWIGYGTVRGASNHWDGRSDSFNQYFNSDSTFQVSKTLFGAPSLL